jgi:putative peptidoglycan lipid II flippase
MVRSRRHPLIHGASVTGLGTLASRVLGMVREVATAAALGMSVGGVMDAFVLAFRIPNLFRRLFGEGALAVSYLPVVTAELERDRARAWQLVSVGLTWLTVILSVIVVLMEGGLALIWLFWGDVPRVRLVVGLSAVMMPYLLLICLAAQVSATLHALMRFTVPALAPALLNLTCLVALWGVAPYVASGPEAEAYVLAVAVIVSGVLQLVVQWPDLRSTGFRFDYYWSAARDNLYQVARGMVPMLIGLTITQINTLMDSLIAWGLSAPVSGAQQIGWLPGALAYPMQPGAVASIYYGERLYQFPLGLLGLAVATAIFPLLSRHAARGDHQRLGDDLTLGCRLVLLFGLPSSAGLVLLAMPLTELLYQHGQFTADDAVRAARMVALYGSGVWAYCASPVVVRGFYALGDRVTPVKIGAAVVGMNFALNLILVWPMAEGGLAAATALTAGIQVVLLLLVFSQRKSHLGWSSLAVTALRTAIATTAMSAAGYLTLHAIPATHRLNNELIRVLVPLAVSLAVYFGVYALIGREELRTLWAAEEEGSGIRNRE